MFELVRETVCGVYAQVSLGSHYLIRVDVGSAETTGEGRQPLIWKTQDRAGHLVDFVKSRLAVICTEGGDLDWLGLKYVARRVYAVDSDVVECSSSQIFLQ